MVARGDEPSLRIAVLCRDPLARRGLEQLLGARPGLALASPAAGGGEVGDDWLDAVLWDTASVPARDVGFLRRPGVPVVALVEDLDEARSALAAGASGAVAREASPEALDSVLRSAAAGFVVLERWAADGLLRLPAADEALRPEPLTPREQEVLQLLAEGRSNRSIGERLAISERTVKFHLNAILGKLGADNRSEAIVRAVRAGLVVL
jgi:DNA-binding NarL/FixJ family response regulator